MRPETKSDSTTKGLTFTVNIDASEHLHGPSAFSLLRKIGAGANPFPHTDDPIVTPKPHRLFTHHTQNESNPIVKPENAKPHPTAKRNADQHTPASWRWCWLWGGVLNVRFGVIGA